MILCSQTYHEIALRVRILEIVLQIDPASHGQPSAPARANASTRLVSAPSIHLARHGGPLAHGWHLLNTRNH